MQAWSQGARAGPRSGSRCPGSALTCLPPSSTPKARTRAPSPAAPKSRPLSPLVPAAAAKTPPGKKTPPGTKSRPKRAQTPARVQPQTPAVVAIHNQQEVQQRHSREEQGGCPPGPRFQDRGAHLSQFET